MSRTKEQMLAAIEEAKSDFKTAIFGEDVRDAMCDIADVVYEAVDDQIITVDATLTTPGAGADAKKIGDDGLLYRGNVQTLEYTKLESCLSGGWYQIPSAYTGSLTDLPDDYPSGVAGFLEVYAYSNRQWQILKTNSNREWHRFINQGTVQSWTTCQLPETGVSPYNFYTRGVSNLLGLTSLAQCTDSGAYQIRRYDLANLSDLPNDYPEDTSSLLLVYAYQDANSNQFQWQHLRTAGNREWRRFINQGVPENWRTCQIPESGASAYNFYLRGTSNGLSLTSLSQCADSGTYQIRSLDLANLDDLPSDYPDSASAVLNAYTYVDPGNGHVNTWQILRTYRGEWTRFINNGTPQGWATMITPKKGYTSGQIHFNVSINGTNMDTTADASDPVSVNAVLVLPSGYTAHGTPTKLIFMHHGVSGTVTETTWYGNSTNWTAMYTAYTDAGFAVFDVNGVGQYASSNNNHKDYGAPRCLQAALKAYEYIRENYNVEEQIYVHGSSMGGATAIAFANMFPELVRAVGLFAPVELRAAAVGNTYKGTIATNYGYASADAMASDGYAKLIPSAPRIEHYNTSGERNFMAFSSSWIAEAGTHLCSFPAPVKIWHGTEDTETSPDYSAALVSAIRAAGGRAYFRSVEDGAHNISTGADSTVNAEAALWFKRF